MNIPDEAVEAAGYLVTIFHNAEEGDGFERLGTFLVQAAHEDDAIDKGFQEARRQHPQAMDMQLDSVAKADAMIAPGGDLRFVQPAREVHLMIPTEATKAAQDTFMEVLADLRLREGGGFKVASQQRRAITAALEAAAPYLMADALEEAAMSFELSPHNTRAKMARHFNNAYVAKLRARAAALVAGAE